MAGISKARPFTNTPTNRPSFQLNELYLLSQY